MTSLVSFQGTDVEEAATETHLVGLAWHVTMDRGRWARGIWFPADCRYMMGVQLAHHVPELVGGVHCWRIMWVENVGTRRRRDDWSGGVLVMMSGKWEARMAGHV